MSTSTPRNIALKKELIQYRMTQARLDRNYSYGKLAEITGLTKSALYKMEHGLSDSVQLVTMLSVAKALDVDFLWLIGLE